MTNGTTQALFIIVAVVIFGIFLLISYMLFRDELKPTLADIFTDSLEQAESNLKGTNSKELEILGDDIYNFKFEQINGPKELDLLRIKKNNNWEKITDTQSFLSLGLRKRIVTEDGLNLEDVKPYLNIVFNLNCRDETETCNIGYKDKNDNYIGIADNVSESIPENLTYNLNIDSEKSNEISAIYMNDVLISNGNNISIKKLFQAMNDLDSVTTKSDNKNKYLFAFNNQNSRHHDNTNLMDRTKNELKIKTTEGDYKIPVDISLINYRLL